MRRVILESPYAGSSGRTVEENIEYAKRCIKDCLKRGESPIASHLLFTQQGILDDEKEMERALGISAGLAWSDCADCVVFYTDFGMSKGMRFSEEIHLRNGVRTEYRTIL